jgi:hypothetical protein
MKLSDKQFQDICTIISKDTFAFMKRKLTRQLNIVSKGDPKQIDTDTVINIIVATLAVLDGNMLTTCKTLFKGMNGYDISMEKLLLSHHKTMMKMLDSVEEKGKLN